MALGVPDYCHGIKSNTCNETTKSLLFPEMTESMQDVEDLYHNKSRRSFGPGEQVVHYPICVNIPGIFLESAIYPSYTGMINN